MRLAPYLFGNFAAKRGVLKRLFKEDLMQTEAKTKKLNSRERSLMIVTFIVVVGVVLFRFVF